MLRRWREALDRRFRGTASGAPQRELPEALGNRLREIPREFFLCRDMDRLWASYLAGELRTEEGARCRDHLGRCGRCRGLVQALQAARSEPVEPSEELLGRLRGIPRSTGVPHTVRPPQRLPWWLLDLRYAGALCYTLSILAVALCGKPADCLAHTAEWTDPVIAAVERMENGSQSAVRSLSEAFRKSPYLRREDPQGEARSETESTAPEPGLP